MRLVVTAVAETQIRTTNDWWRENRQAAPDLLVSELSRAFDLIQSHPFAGAAATNAELTGVRRVLLRGAGYHLYYRVDPETVEVLALWHANRGGEPPL